MLNYTILDHTRPVTPQCYQNVLISYKLPSNAQLKHSNYFLLLVTFGMQLAYAGWDILEIAVQVNKGLDGI